MPVSIVPALIGALVTQATAALPGSLVLCGYGSTDDASGLILMVGVDDGDSLAAAQTSTGSQVMATAGTPRTRRQTGTVTCWSLAWNGDSDQQAAIVAAYAQFEAVAALLRADPTLGLSSGYQVVVCQIGDETLQTNTTSVGAEARLTFTVAFDATL